MCVLCSWRLNVSALSGWRCSCSLQGRVSSAGSVMKAEAGRLTHFTLSGFDWTTFEPIWTRKGSKWWTVGLGKQLTSSVPGFSPTLCCLCGSCHVRCSWIDSHRPTALATHKRVWKKKSSLAESQTMLNLQIIRLALNQSFVETCAYMLWRRL